MNSISVKKGDNVLVIAGKDNGKVAKVIAANPKTNKVIVEGVNIVTKCKKARTAQEKSTIVKQEAPIDASNVMVVCPSCGKATRVAHAVIDGKKVRVCKHADCKASLEVPAKAKKAEKKTVAKKTTTKKADAETTATAEKKTTAKKTTTRKTTAKTAENKD